MKVSCPQCKEVYETSKLIPDYSRTATIICSKCQTQFEVTQGKVFKWWWPTVKDRTSIRNRDKDK